MSQSESVSKTTDSFPEEDIPVVLKKLEKEATARYLSRLETALHEGPKLGDFYVFKNTRFYIGSIPQEDKERREFRISVLEKPLYYLDSVNFGVTQDVEDGMLEMFKAAAEPAGRAKFVEIGRKERMIYGIVCFDPPLEPSRESYYAAVKAAIPGTWDPLRNEGKDLVSTGSCNPSVLNAVTLHFPEQIWSPQKDVIFYPVDPENPDLPVNSAIYSMHIDRKGGKVIAYITTANREVCENHYFRVELRKRI